MKKIAQFLTATVFNSQEAYDKYMKEHPADKTKHSVKKNFGGEVMYKTEKDFKNDVISRDIHRRLMKLNKDSYEKSGLKPHPLTMRPNPAQINDTAADIYEWTKNITHRALKNSPELLKKLRDSERIVKNLKHPGKPTISEYDKKRLEADYD